MKIDVKIKMKKYTITLTEKQQKHQHYLQLRLRIEEILPFDQSRIIEQAKSTYSPLSKAFKNNRNKWRSRNKTCWSFKTFKTRRKPRTRVNWWTFFKKKRNNEVKNEIKEKIKPEDLKYKTKIFRYDFQQHGTIRSLVIILTS